MHYDDNSAIEGEEFDEKIKAIIEKEKQEFYDLFKPEETQMRVANKPKYHRRQSETRRNGSIRQKKKLILTIELVPKTSWYNNLRKVIPQEKWDVLRRETYAQYGHKCGICGTTGKLNCHEIWSYDDSAYVQSLEGFVALCDFCHHVKHIGFAGILAQRGEIDYESVIEHFMQVNHCDLQTFEEHKAEAFRQWHKRSTHEWTVELGEFSHLITEDVKIF